MSINIKKRTFLPWKYDFTESGTSTGKTMISIDTSSTIPSYPSSLGTSNFSNLSNITAKTPPSYSVFENSAGEMVNEKRGVKWPERPLTGYFSLKEYKKRKAFIQKSTEEQDKIIKKQHEKKKMVEKGLKETTVDKDIQCSDRKDFYQNIEDCNKTVLENIPKSHLNNNCTKDFKYITNKYVKKSSIFCGVKSSDDAKVFVTDYNTYYYFYDTKKIKNKISYNVPLKVAYYSYKLNKIVIEDFNKDSTKCTT